MSRKGKANRAVGADNLHGEILHAAPLECNITTISMLKASGSVESVSSRMEGEIGIPSLEEGTIGLPC